MGGLGLAEADLEVNLEAQVGNHRRIDIEVGYTVIEVKKSLAGSVASLRAAENQLRDYVAARVHETGQRYVGVLTDGAEWRAYQLHDGVLAQASQYILKTGRPDLTGLLTWLEGVLATRQGVPPTPSEIRVRLGADSASYQLDYAALAALYEAYGATPTVQLKRRLWSGLLRSALGTQFTEDTELFLEHTLLVNSAEIIAHLVLGFDVIDLQPATLLGGEHFRLARISGVVEQDFFDWILEVPGGEAFVSTLARRLARFDWRHVEHDVLKILYESIIGPDTRARLGEYYTPDWLAEQVIAEAVTDPLRQRVLDPACGSGTFLFHAVRRYLTAAETDAVPLADALEGVTRHVYGLDLHPVAVALARVTYLLAIGKERLRADDRRGVHVPVYLGDSVQWKQEKTDLFTGGQVVVDTGEDGPQIYGNELRFPETLLADAANFDTLIEELAKLAASPRRPGTVPPLTALFNRRAIAAEDREAIRDSFARMCRLHDDDQDHIWGYYVRNLARPRWLSRPENRADVLVGNPPWLAYRRMPEDMQRRFRELCEARGLWHGREVATHQDLSGLFVTRAVQQFLRVGGAFAFVLPNAALDRGYFKGFRSGLYPDQAELTTVAFTHSWDLRRLRPHFFPRGAAVVFGTRTGPADGATPLPTSTLRWIGRLPKQAPTWDVVSSFLSFEAADLVVHDANMLESPYKLRFFQGATLVPRVLFFVERRPTGPLGLPYGRRAVRSVRGSKEKSPWKELPSLEGVVESEFVRPVLLGESVLPYRLLTPREAILPLEKNQLLDGQHPRIDLYPDLATWWRKAERIWVDHRSSNRLTLTEQLDFRRKLTSQLPPSALRVVYGASGMHVAAGLVDDPSTICDKALYWGTVNSHDEGYFLCAILNAPVLTQLVRPLMSYGKDERHIDKHVWKLPIPFFDPENEVHARLAGLGLHEAALVMSLELDENTDFIALRRLVRRTLATGPYSQEIEELVVGLLDG
ncbi:SAM-dependent DNA methyltransferase [Sphaerisporangium album]|uniref:SAM-dependent DNA methyltransferase n=1 Tax=Sphaerisporangium album TaxID=509200 RepID=A0A367FTF7_9ACTN|nr:SAM-dependent DNA methyltransferase [Sphaerisporangium album]